MTKPDNTKCKFCGGVATKMRFRSTICLLLIILNQSALVAFIKLDYILLGLLIWVLGWTAIYLEFFDFERFKSDLKETRK